MKKGSESFFFIDVCFIFKNCSFKKILFLFLIIRTLILLFLLASTWYEKYRVNGVRDVNVSFITAGLEIVFKKVFFSGIK